MYNVSMNGDSDDLVTHVVVAAMTKQVKFAAFH